MSPGSAGRQPNRCRVIALDAGTSVAAKPASSAITRQRFGWQPVQPGLIADLDAPAGYYFAQSSSLDQDVTEE